MYRVTRWPPLGRFATLFLVVAFTPSRRQKMFSSITVSKNNTVFDDATYVPMEEEDKKFALEFLRGHSTAVLATASVTGEPQAAPMYFLVDDDFTFHFFTAKNSQKVKHIKQNKHVAIVVGFGPEITTVQVRGDAEFDDHIAPGLFWKLVEKIKLGDIFQWPLAVLAKGGGYTAFRLKPRVMSLLKFEKGKDPRIYYNDF